MTLFIRMTAAAVVFNSEITINYIYLIETHLPQFIIATKKNTPPQRCNGGGVGVSLPSLVKPAADTNEYEPRS